MFAMELPDLDEDLRSFLPNSDMSELQKCTTHAQRVNFFLIEKFLLQLQAYLAVTRCCERAKNDERSIEIREEGNLQFRDKKYYEALQTYTSSIVWAKSKAVAALAYGNRSAVLARFGSYEECLIDIDRAFKHEYPEESKLKLLRRQKEVRELLLQKNRKEVPKTEIVDGRNLSIQSATNAVKIESNEKYGRHIVAARDIKIGELLVVEEPYTIAIFKDFLLRCQQCAGLCYNLIPCDNCTQAMYCTELCKEKAYQKYHKYECVILDHLRQFLPYSIPVLKTTLTARNELAVEKNFAYRSDRFDEISQLLTHPDTFLPNIMLRWYFVTATIFMLLKEKTTLFKDFVDFEETFKESFVLNVMRWKTNGIPISKGEGDGEFLKQEDYAIGLYSLASLFNHSCYPNTFFYHEGSKIIVRAQASIKKGEQCFISYGPIYHEHPKPYRTKEIQDKFFFTCECKACEENWPPIGELYEGSVIAYIRSSQQDRFYLEMNQLMLARIENRAPSVEINSLRRIIREQYCDFKILPQAS